MHSVRMSEGIQLHLVCYWFNVIQCQSLLAEITAERR